ncbi:GlxA family transcriptional regulator [Stenotrophomonas sp. Iso1]|uniref:GlxA family transcriptional regulator n=1 Tax=Stenotrophomonas sp. Iso1 TaxID=2977283 RepID=UPI0022B7D318|nr:GlxA family transcriptional regulator [Stenotrophomonas sp. Iso1]
MRNDGHIEIGILLYPGAQLAAVLGLTDLLTLAGRIANSRAQPGTPALHVTHWHIPAPGQPLTSNDASHPTAADALDVLILPPSLEDPISPEAAAPYVDWLRSLHDGGTTLASVCAGAYLLGETGRAAGRTITTNWAFNDSFATRFPEIQLDTDQLVIDAGDILTAGGAMAWIDLGLRLVERYLGAAVMLDTARTLLVDPLGRQQRYYSSFAPRISHGDAAVLAVQNWLHDTHAKETALPDLARRAGMEERTFLRRFQKATGMTATEYCQRVRVARARELLQSTRLPLERIAWDVGYSDPGSFRKVFSRIVGLTPGDYRRRFNTG